MRGIVVCPQPRAAEVGAEVLEAGGNAFDAAVATAFVQMVVDPFMCGIGGMVSVHVWAPAKGEHRIIDGSLRTGSRVRPDMWSRDYQGRAPLSGSSIFADHRSEIGYTSICVPGTVAGFAEVHRRYCTRPWADLLQPAIHIAREGFQVAPFMYNVIRWKPYPGTPDGLTRLRASGACVHLYLAPDGSPLEVGQMVRNTDYADVLELLAARGPGEFYRGELARAVAQDLEANGSFITREDLEKYRALVHEPAETTYRGYRVCSSRAPNAGSLLLEALNILEGFDLTGLEHNGLAHLNLLAATLLAVFQDRLSYLRDPETSPENPEAILLSREHARHLQERIRAGKVKMGAAGGNREHTTHVVVVDRWGNIASITHSLGYISGVITPGLGFMYNNGMNNFHPVPGHANSLAPGKARLSTMIPTMVFQNGRPVLALGAPGGNVILSACLQAMLNVLDFNMTAVEAVSAPRIHAEDSAVLCEARIRSDVCSSLIQRGYTVEHDVWSYGPWFALVQMARLWPDGRMEGASDPRGGGGVVYARSQP